MQIVNGRAGEQTMTVKELAKRVPTRLIRLMLRIAGLSRGHHIILIDVGDDSLQWRVGNVGNIER